MFHMEGATKSNSAKKTYKIRSITRVKGVDNPFSEPSLPKIKINNAKERSKEFMNFFERLSSQ